jgi:hypothetical protein
MGCEFFSSCFDVTHCNFNMLAIQCHCSFTGAFTGQSGPKLQHGLKLQHGWWRWFGTALGVKKRGRLFSQKKGLQKIGQKGAPQSPKPNGKLLMAGTCLGVIQTGSFVFG